MSGIMSMLLGAVSSAADEFFNRVTLLLNTSSTNGAQNNTFLDSSSNNFTITRNGNTTQGTFTPFSQTGWSNFFNGTTDYLTVPDNAATDLASGTSWTVEAWIYRTSSGATQIIMGSQTSAGSVNFLLYVNSSNQPVVQWTNTVPTNFIVTSAVAINANEWTHIAGVNNGGTLSLYVNGVSRGTPVTLTGTYRNLSSAFGIGRGGDSTSSYLPGYISNARVVNGTAVYTTGFTPPTTPLTAITNTSLLTCQSNRFVDNSTNAFTVTIGGTPRVQAFSPFAPTAAYDTTTVGGSGYFDGTGDYLSGTVAAVNNTTMTIECWVYNTSLDNTNGNHYFQINNGSFANYALTHNANGVARFYSLNNTGTTIFDLQSSSGAIKLNQWQHIVGVRTSGNASLYVDGVRLATTASPTTSTISGTALYVGTNTATGRYLTGYISNSRVVSGTAVYDPTLSTLTVPTAPLTAITNTSLLLNYTNAGIYDAAAKNDLETVGNAQVSTTQTKFGTTSIAFDGTGDWLTVIDNPNLRMEGGDFTIEGWFYLSATGVAYGIVSKGTSTTGWSVNVTSGNKLQFSYTSSNLTGATTLSSATWYYFAVVRAGTATGNLKIYLNGSADATSGGAVTDTFNQTNIMYVGADRTGGSGLNGYVDDLRITKGYARTITTSPSSAFALQ